MPRPPLGVLRLSTGDVVTPRPRRPARPRAPSSAPAWPPHDRPHVVKVPSPERDVSRNHVEVVLEGWHVLVRDLGTTNGTTVTLPRRAARCGCAPATSRSSSRASVVSHGRRGLLHLRGGRVSGGCRHPETRRAWSTSQPLGSGGYADVYLYEQQMPRMPVAVKVLKSEGLTDALRRQFAEEADTMAALGDHPYIVQVFRVRHLGRRPPVPRHEVLPAAEPRAAGPRRAAHRRGGAAHRHPARQRRRDRPPGRHHPPRHQAGQRPRQRVRRARASPTSASPAAARADGDGPRSDEPIDDVGVSVPWAPPEVLYGQSNGDERADVYSLAATLWQLLVGRSPFEVPGGDNSAYALMPRIRSTAPPGDRRRTCPPASSGCSRRRWPRTRAHRPGRRSSSPARCRASSRSSGSPAPRSSSSTSRATRPWSARPRARRRAAAGTTTTAPASRRRRPSSPSRSAPRRRPRTARRGVARKPAASAGHRPRCPARAVRPRRLPCVPLPPPTR